MNPLQLMMTFSLEALSRVGLEDERELAVEQGRELFDRLKGLSIQNRSLYTLRELFSLSPFLPGEDLLGDDWIEDARRVLVGDARAELGLFLAEIQGDWPEAEQSARAFIEKHHTYYDVYFRLGRAIYKQGRLTSPGSRRARNRKFNVRDIRTFRLTRPS